MDFEEIDGIFDNAELASLHHYVGLINQGRTCYFNTCIQVLYMTPEIKNSIYQWKKEIDENLHNPSYILSELCTLFHSLQTSNESAIETVPLTNALGWNIADTQQQRDVHEFYQNFLIMLESLFENTSQSEVIHELYTGTIVDCIKCLKCNTESSHETTFRTLQLPVRHCHSDGNYTSVEEALGAFFATEKLVDDNQYMCNTCQTMTDSEKRIELKNVPNILTLQLNRFAFDYKTMEGMKLNNRVTFPHVLDVNGYISQNYKEYFTSNSYELFSIMIHEGAVDEGHNYAFIKDFRSKQWQSFNDSIVTQITDEDIQRMFGNSYGDNSNANAYILMYRRIERKNSTYKLTEKEIEEQNKSCASINNDLQDDVSEVGASILREVVPQINQYMSIQRYDDIAKWLANCNFNNTSTSLINEGDEMKTSSFSAKSYPKIEHLSVKMKEKYLSYRNKMEKYNYFGSEFGTNTSLISANTDINVELSTEQNLICEKSKDNEEEQLNCDLKNESPCLQNMYELQTIDNFTTMKPIEEMINVDCKVDSDCSLNITSEKSIQSTKSGSSFLSRCSQKTGRESSQIRQVLTTCPYCKLRGSNVEYCTRCKQALPGNVEKIVINSYDMFVSDNTNSISSTDAIPCPNKKMKIHSQNPFSDELNKTILIYPRPPATGGFEIKNIHLKCLEEGRFLSDIIIDFYLLYIISEITLPTNRDKIHLFSYFFFKRLTSIEGNTVAVASQRYQLVQKWTKKTNIFEKEFIVIPVNQNYHWFLIIVCFASLCDKAKEQFYESASDKVPCIVVLNSMRRGYKAEVQAIREYLNCEFQKKKNGKNHLSSSKSLPAIYPRVPQQQNGYDCGIYLLQFAENFLMNPINDFVSLPKEHLEQWFTHKTIKHKRQQIRSLIMHLAKKK